MYYQFVISDSVHLLFFGCKCRSRIVANFIDFIQCGDYPRMLIWKSVAVVVHGDLDGGMAQLAGYIRNVMASGNADDGISGRAGGNKSCFSFSSSVGGEGAS